MPHFPYQHFHSLCRTRMSIIAITINTKPWLSTVSVSWMPSVHHEMILEGSACKPGSTALLRSVHTWAGLTVTKTLAATAMVLSHAGKSPPSFLWPMVVSGDLGLWRRVGGTFLQEFRVSVGLQEWTHGQRTPGHAGCCCCKDIHPELFVRRRLLMEPSDSLIG